VHDAFATPDRIRTQLVETADGAAYLTIAMASPRSGVAFDDGRSAGLLAVVVGCPIDQIGEVVYGDDYAVEDESARARIGAGCRVCQWMDCDERAVAPIGSRIGGSEWVRGVSPIPLDTANA
ncbi:MAG: short-chain fatty acyl-CoA regulator family protein, partial [Pseudomonadota bacterium]